MSNVSQNLHTYNVTNKIKTTDNNLNFTICNMYYAHAKLHQY